MRPPLKLRKSLNPAYLKIKPGRRDIELFKEKLINLLDHINTAEHEEFNKNLFSDFLKGVGFEPRFFINPKGRNDLVMHTDKSPEAPILLEAEIDRMVFELYGLTEEEIAVVEGSVG